MKERDRTHAAIRRRQDWQGNSYLFILLLLLNRI